MGTYSRTKYSSNRKRQGFTYLDTKSEQFEREKKKVASLKVALTEKNNEIRRLEKEISVAESYLKELETAINVRDMKIAQLEGTIKVQRGIIEDLS